MNCSAPSIHIATESWAFLHGMFACQAEALGATAIYCEETLPLSATNSIPLALTDRKGLANSASTPIVVATASSTTNKAPTAVATATPSTGTIPLTVSFSKTGSTDSDGSISSYVWNFGDSSTATGKTAPHTYTTAANISATLQVTDDKGAKNTTSIPITVDSLNALTDLNIELGEVTVTPGWVHVPLTSTFTNPIVVASPPSFKGSNPCVVRLQNISRTGFDIRVAEWNYLDGVHVAETVNYLVMEKGRTTLPDGSMIEAGSFAGTTSFKNVTFSKSFVKKPVVITTIATENETETISGRIKNIGLLSFAYYFREQEKNTNTHIDETVNFIAWEPGKGKVGSIQFEAATTANAVTQNWYAKTFQGSFEQPPLLLADMQTTNNTDTAALRVQKVSATSFQVKVQEEQSLDKEVAHPAETVGYLVLDKIEE